MTDGIEAFCRTVRAGLATATFPQRRQLAELLIDRVIVTDDQVDDPLRPANLPRRPAPALLPIA